MKKKSLEVLHDSTFNKSLAFTREEREQLGLKGLLPYSVATQDMQVKRVIAGIRRKAYDIERYIFLAALQDRNERLFYRVILEYIEELLPIIYTPTVGQACREFSHIYRRARGFYITPEDEGRVSAILDNWPEKDVRVIVVTDGQRILGLGDLGANGMGIPIGKLALYSACAGIPPYQCLPVMLDVGTNNPEILDDLLYLGYPHKRLEGEAYLTLADEFVSAIQEKYPHALIQFEDFATPNAYALLNTYRDRILCFNDDIQGTAAVVLAGVYASTRITGIDFSDLRILFLGAGSAATGIADLMATAFMDEGASKEDAYRHLWFVDSKGLVVSGRADLAAHKLPYAHDHESLNFREAIGAIKPHVLIGATGAAGSFAQDVIEQMTGLNDRPVIFALSNPTSKVECTAEQAYTWSQGKAVFASGSPFDPVRYGDEEFRPGQGNNAYVFPGIGLGAIISKARLLPDTVFLAAARTLAALVEEKDIQAGGLYPRITEIREISLAIATAVAETVYTSGLAQNEKPADLKQVISDYMFDPHY